MPEDRPFVQHDRTDTLEIFVRPSVIPVFRPPPARPILPLPDPEQGKAVITGTSGGQAIMLTKSEQSSWSRSVNVETRRTVDRVRIYQKEKDGTVNKENFVDVEEAKEIRMADGTGVQMRYQYADPVDPKDVPDNIEILEQDIEKINKDYYEKTPKVDDDREPNVG